MRGLCVGTDAGIALMNPHDVLPRAHLQMVAAGVDPLDDPTALLRVVGVWHLGRRVI